MSHVEERKGHLPASSRPVSENPTEQRYQSNEQVDAATATATATALAPGPGPRSRATSIDTIVVKLSREVSSLTTRNETILLRLSMLNMELSEMEAHMIGSSSSPPTPLPLLPVVTPSLPMNDRETISGSSSLSNIYLAGRNDDNGVDVDVDAGVDDDGNDDTGNISGENGDPRGASEVVGEEYEWVNCGGAETMRTKKKKKNQGVVIMTIMMSPYLGFTFFLSVRGFVCSANGSYLRSTATS
ncbi:hypothetical protein EMCG_06024 [[Emmonsia] crescens]|uniref:Uncharacterized protein n=1 Tax=[Emmonsia] crescens TaxID=73230 RepID=A0A0G2ICG7_9EURO|nr:hypothetical protein EMCG_06024 [Emmonsia crescens UAMH 3008]